MQFNNLTYNISIAILSIGALYTLLYSGLTGLLLCSAVTLITAAFLNQFELVVAVAIIFAMFYISFLQKWIRRIEPFQNEDTSQAILNRVAHMTGQYQQIPQSLRCTAPWNQPLSG